MSFLSPVHGSGKMTLLGARGVQNTLGGVVVNEEGVLRSWPAPVGYPLQRGDALLPYGPEDLEELLSSISTIELGHWQILLVEKLIACLLAKDEAKARDITKEEDEDGLCVFHDYEALHHDVSKVKHLAKEVSQAGTGVDNLAVYEGVELVVIVPLVEITEGMRGDPGDVFGMTQHPVEVKNYAWFVLGLKSIG